MPVTILEIGTMTNENDRNQMENVEFRDMMTMGIVEGVDAYFGIDTSGTDITASLSGSGSNERLDALMAELAGRLPQNNGQWSVFVGDLSSGASSSIGSQPMLAASLIKLYIMGAVYENYDVLSQTYGAGTLDSLLSPMITVSDNDAANTLTSYLGGGDSSAGMAAVTGYAQAHGFFDSSMGRLLLHSNEFGDNYTSVNDCGQLLMQIYNNSTGKDTSVPLAGADAMFQLLKGQTRRHKIPSQMPSDVGVANKTGELDNVENDAAIIYNVPTGNDLVIVFMSQNVAPGNAQATIAELSRFIYDYLI
ncbi:MAG: serine hydrolase [Blautia sp.]|nr:serine hydrolase [Blautia sp.]